MGKKGVDTQYNLIQGYQDAIEGRRGEFQGQRADVGSFRKSLESMRTAPRPDIEAARGDIGTARGTYTGMISDESKRGYSPLALGGMRGRAADTLAGARRTNLEDLNRRVAASGMGATGVGLRAGMDYGRDYARQQRESLRDIDLANEEAKRSDLWNALGGVERTAGLSQGIQKGEDAFQTANLGMQQQTYDQQLQAMNAETQLQALRASLYDPMNQMIAEKNKPGFWSQLALSLAGGAGQAAGAYFGARQGNSGGGGSSSGYPGQWGGG